MHKIFLNDAELIEITEYRYRGKQHQQLAKMGIPFEITRTGRPLVLRSTLETILGNKKHRTKQGVNLDALWSISRGTKEKI